MLPEVTKRVFNHNGEIEVVFKFTCDKDNVYHISTISLEPYFFSVSRNNIHFHKGDNLAFILTKKGISSVIVRSVIKQIKKLGPKPMRLFPGLF